MFGDMCCKLRLPILPEAASIPHVLRQFCAFYFPFLKYILQTCGQALRCWFIHPHSHAAVFIEKLQGPSHSKGLQSRHQVSGMPVHLTAPLLLHLCSSTHVLTRQNHACASGASEIKAMKHSYILHCCHEALMRTARQQLPFSTIPCFLNGINNRRMVAYEPPAEANEDISVCI